MKKIEILHDDNKAVILEDDDNSNITEYTEKITRIFELSNITTIFTSSGAYIVRPYKIKGIFVREINKKTKNENKNIEANNIEIITDKE